MRFSTCTLGILSLTYLTTLAACEEIAARPIEKADSVLAIYPEDWRLGARTRVPALILAAWPDGHIVWSKDHQKGGPPYFSGRVDPVDVASVLSRLEHDGIFADKDLNVPNVGPDSRFTTLLIRSGKKELRMQSWHEPFEAGGETVAGRHGVSGLGGQLRLEALRKEPAEYLYYRFVWSETRGKLIDLIPNEGKRLSGNIIPTKRGVSWVETPAEAEAAANPKK
jgi:hypothetical protein